jgi:hypothetical protein
VIVVGIVLLLAVIAICVFTRRATPEDKEKLDKKSKSRTPPELKESSV